MTEHFLTLSQIARKYNIDKDELIKALRREHYIDISAPTIKSGIYSEICIDESGIYYSKWNPKFIYAFWIKYNFPAACFERSEQECMKKAIDYIHTNKGSAFIMNNNEIVATVSITNKLPVCECCGKLVCEYD